LCRSGIEFGLPTTGDEHALGAFGNEPLRGSQSDAGIGSGDDGGLVV
jgi:hypothetical protein